MGSTDLEPERSNVVGKNNGKLSKRVNKTKRDWLPYTIATCSAVLLAAVILNLDVIGGVFTTIGNFVFPVFLGVVFAYIMNPLVNIFDTKVFKKIKKEAFRQKLSVMITFILVMVIIVLLLTLLITQLVESVMTLVGNMDVYIKNIEGFLRSLDDITGGHVDLSAIVASSDKILDGVQALLPDDPGAILNKSKNIGSGLVNIVLGAILSLYFMLERDNLMRGVRKLLHAVLPDDVYRRSSVFWHKCDQILIRYIAYSILDAIIVGVANAIFMMITGMNYVVMVSTIVGVTNLAPTFGPIVGAIVGALVLVLSNPWDAVLFLVFTVILQTLDGYVIKPKLFGGTFGISGLWILVGIIVGGRMFGVTGILFAIPAVAIIDYVYQNYILKKLEEIRDRRAQKTLDEQLSEQVSESATADKAE